MRTLIKKVLNEQTELLFIKSIVVNYLLKNGVPISRLVTAVTITPQLQIDVHGKLKQGVDIQYPKRDVRKLNLDRQKISDSLKLSENEKDLFDQISDDDIIKSYGDSIGYDLNKVSHLLSLLDYEGKPVMFYENDTFILTTPDINFGDWTSARGYIWLLGDKFSINITNLSNLNNTKGNFGIYDVNLNRFGGMSNHDGNLTIGYSQIKNWDTLTNIGGNLTIYDSSTVNSLGSLKSVGGNVKIMGVVNDTGELEFVGGDFIVNNNTTLNSLGNIKVISGRLRMRNSSITDLGNLQEVTGGVLVSKDISSDLLSEFKRRGIKVKKG